MRAKKDGDLAGYEAWLLERRLTAEHCVRHFGRWVVRFLGLRRSRPRESWQDTLTVFLQDLGDGRYKPWQVRQAGHAVTLYCGQFCERLETPVAPTGPTRGRGGAPGKGSRSGSGERRKDEDVLTHAEMLAEVRRILRLRHYAGSTERSYLVWNRRFLRCVGPLSGEHLPTGDDVQAFLSHLAVQGDVSASTQNQAFHAVLFLLRHVLVVDPGDLSGTVRARQGHKLPVVLLPDETRCPGGSEGHVPPDVGTGVRRGPGAALAPGGGLGTAGHESSGAAVG